MITTSNTKSFLVLTVLLFPLTGHCWNVVQHNSGGIDYVSVVGAYDNDKYKLKLEQPCAGEFSWFASPSWEIQANSNIKEWIELSNNSLYLYIDSNPYK